MYRIVTKAVVLFSFLMLLPGGYVQASWNKTLVTIDGVEYTAQDYRDWWTTWQERDMAFFDSPQEFIDFQLLAAQAREMEYDRSPQYQRKVEVFLIVRSLAALKYEEVDSKIDIPEEVIKAAFAEKFAPVWQLQLLTYDDQAKAREVSKVMKNFAGQKAGRLVFADFAGVKAEEGGALSYEEIQLYPARIGQDSAVWLAMLASLPAGSVSEPFFLESLKRYAVVRMDEVLEPSEEVYQRERTNILQEFEKQARNELTGDLIKRLMEKYHVRIDEELLQSVKVEGDNPEEILPKAVAQMDGLDLTVEYLILNAQKQRKMRVDLPEDQLKRVVINGFITQNITDKEALSRHYEERPPLKSVYEFYRANTLRKVLLEDMQRRIVVTDEEIKNYYDNNSSLYTQPGSISYAIIQADLDLLNTIVRAISQGADFFDEARSYALDANLKTVATDVIEVEVESALANLQKNEVSAPFPFQVGYAVVRLLNRAEGGIVPLARVRAGIERLLRDEKFSTAKKIHLDKVRSLANVKVDKNVWLKLKEEYKNEKN